MLLLFVLYFMLMSTKAYLSTPASEAMELKVFIRQERREIVRRRKILKRKCGAVLKEMFAY